MASEICFFKLKPGTDLRDPSSPAGKVWQSITDGMSKVDGFQTFYYGMGVEDKTLINIILDWESMDAYNTWKTTESYSTIIKGLVSLMDEGGQRIFHVHWNTHPPTAPTSAPVTEFAIFHLSADLSESDKAEYEKTAVHFGEVITAEAKGSTGAVGGWATTPLEHNGQKTTAFLALLGWESVDAHLQFRETDTFKGLIGGMRGGMVGAEVHHATLDQLGN